MTAHSHRHITEALELVKMFFSSVWGTIYGGVFRENDSYMNVIGTLIDDPVKHAIYAHA